MNINDEILKHLFSNKKFLQSLKRYFNKAEIDAMLAYVDDNDRDYPEALDELHELLPLEYEDEKKCTNVLTIGWNSSSWGPGGNGYVRFLSVYGIVTMFSSDFSDERAEIFDKNRFFPWAIETLDNDFIEISSDVYDKKYLLQLAKKMRLGEQTKLIINDEPVN